MTTNGGEKHALNERNRGGSLDLDESVEKSDGEMEEMLAEIERLHPFAQGLYCEVLLYSPEIIIEFGGRFFRAYKFASEAVIERMGAPVVLEVFKALVPYREG
jgi:hypothetical protein